MWLETRTGRLLISYHHGWHGIMGNGGCSQSIICHLWGSSMVTLLHMAPSHRTPSFHNWSHMQLSQHFSIMAPCHEAYPSGSAPAQSHGWQFFQPSWPTMGHLYRCCGSGPGLLLWGYPQEGCAPSRLHLLLHSGLFHGCAWRFAPFGAHGCRETSCSSVGLSVPGAPPTLFLHCFWGLQSA